MDCNLALRLADGSFLDCRRLGGDNRRYRKFVPNIERAAPIMLFEPCFVTVDLGAAVVDREFLSKYA